MKKLIILLLTLALFGCSSTTLKLTKEAKNGISLTAGAEFDPSTLVEVKEGADVNYELAGDKYVITSGEEIQEVPVTYELMEVDGTLPVDLSKFYSDSSKLAKVSYVFNEDETVMTVTDENGEPYSFDVPVHVYYPSYTIADNIEIDTYVGYDINDFVTVDEDVAVTAELDEENSVLNITLTKNNWSVNESKEVVLTNSNPYPMKFSSLYMYSGGIEFPAKGQYITILSDTNAEGYFAPTGEKWDVAVSGNTFDDSKTTTGGSKRSFRIDGDYLYDHLDYNGPGTYFLYKRVYE